MDDFLNWLEKRAEQLRLDAGFGGSHSDGGAKVLQDQVTIYRHARAGEMPPLWMKLWNEYDRDRDPEYAEYLRLQKKFEGHK